MSVKIRLETDDGAIEVEESWMDPTGDSDLTSVSVTIFGDDEDRGPFVTLIVDRAEFAEFCRRVAGA